jgi:4-amino-4-deoxy-L-arabinose transferase-like glycosyltransferase
MPLPLRRQPVQRVAKRHPLTAHAAGNRPDYTLAALLAGLTALTRIVNIGGYPRLFTDENVYVSQAWAVQYQGTLANYTYWYDHPPVGWIQMAVYSALTGALPRHHGLTTMAGREYMVVMSIAGTVLLYMLGRRLGLRRSFAFLAGLLYVLSPLAVSFSRYVLLDNIAIVWCLASMVLALSPKRRISAAVGSGLCAGIAFLSKETVLLPLAGAFYLLVSNYWQPSLRGLIGRIGYLLRVNAYKYRVIGNDVYVSGGYP